MVEHIEQQRPLACKACDGLGLRIVLQGGYLAICERCKGTGEAEVVITPSNENVGLPGSVPMALGTGVGSKLRPHPGIAMVGGLLLSKLLTLYTTLLFYL